MIISLDIGKVRIGVAVKRPNQAIEPLKTLKRAQNTALHSLIELISKNKVTKIIAGIPLNQEDLPTEQAKDIKKFLMRLHKRCDTPIFLVDEFNSSNEAKERLNNSQNSIIQLKNNGAIDSMSAVIILESYLENQGVIGNLLQLGE